MSNLSFHKLWRWVVMIIVSAIVFVPHISSVNTVGIFWLFCAVLVMRLRFQQLHFFRILLSGSGSHGLLNPYLLFFNNSNKHRPVFFFFFSFRFRKVLLSTSFSLLFTLCLTNSPFFSSLSQLFNLCLSF